MNKLPTLAMEFGVCHMIKRTAVTDLRNDLIETGYDYISNDGYKLLIDNRMVENSSQAKALAAVIRDVSDVVYSRGYREGQLYQKGFDDAQKSSQNN